MAEAGLEVKDRAVRKDEHEDEDCLCGSPHNCCDMHPCCCGHCKGGGRGKMRCEWRKSMKCYLHSHRIMEKRRLYLKKWRAVKQDTKLKKAPGWMDLARQRKVDTSHMKSPSRRCMLETLSSHAHITHLCSVLNVSKTIGRTSWRKDGLVPTLGHGCLGMYVPSAAMYLEVPQLLALTGFEPEAHGAHFRLASEVAPTKMDLLIGNAMTLPVVGSVMAGVVGGSWSRSQRPCGQKG